MDFHRTALSVFAFLDDDDDSPHQRPSDEIELCGDARSQTTGDISSRMSSPAFSLNENASSFSPKNFIEPPGLSYMNRLPSQEDRHYGQVAEGRHFPNTHAQDRPKKIEYGYQGLQDASFGMGDAGETVYRIQFKQKIRNHLCSPHARLGGRMIRIGDYTTVEIERQGIDVGVVIESLPLSQLLYRAKMEVSQGNDEYGIIQNGRIIRFATQFEIQQMAQKYREEAGVMQAAQALADLQMLPVRVMDAEYQFDRQLLTVFYSSEMRVDGCGWARDLFKRYRTRIALDRLHRSQGSSSQEKVSDRCLQNGRLAQELRRSVPANTHCWHRSESSPTGSAPHTLAQLHSKHAARPLGFCPRPNVYQQDVPLSPASSCSPASSSSCGSWGSAYSSGGSTGGGEIAGRCDRAMPLSMTMTEDSRRGYLPPTFPPQRCLSFSSDAEQLCAPSVESGGMMISGGRGGAAGSAPRFCAQQQQSPSSQDYLGNNFCIQLC